jgi:spermidine/putrescine transport system ATP-binding protein
VNRPNVLLLDEPLGALDLKLRKQLQIELKRVQAEVGITFVYVTHDQEEALTMSDRIAVMNRGKVEQLGSPEELYERPNTRFVADFIGTTNLLSGAVESSDAAGALVRLAGGDTCVVAGAGLQVGRTVELSVRPESILVKASNGTTPGGVEPIRGHVEQVAYLGGNVQYQVRTNGGLAITALAPKTGQRLPVGSDVDVVWPPAEALVLAGPGGEEEAPA